MRSEFDAYLGSRVKLRRAELGYTLAVLADHVGVRFQQLQKYETGQVRMSAARLWSLGRVLGVPPSYFYEGLPARVATQHRPKMDEAVQAPSEPTNALDVKGAYDLLQIGRSADIVPFPNTATTARSR